MQRLYEVAQRCTDILLSGLGLLISAIPCSVIAVSIKLDPKGPVFYRQRRVGRKGKVLQIIKFRTMTRDAESGTGPVWTVKQDPRVTCVGAFLRRLRLDELPRLFNILKGEMAFVAPRPERPEFVYQFVQYIPAFDRRHDVKPGIAGFTQLRNGYDNSPQSVYKKLRRDAEYMRKRCLMTDFCILCRTVMAVLKRKV